MKAQVAIVSIATALLLGGCTSSNVEAASPVDMTASAVVEATPPVSPTPSPEVADMTKEEAAQQYLDLVKPANDLIDETSQLWEDAINANDWQQVAALAARSLEAERALRDGAIAASWPADLMPLIDEFVSQQDADIAWYLALVNATSEEEFWAAYDAIDVLDRRASDEIRLRLGLESVN